MTTLEYVESLKGAMINADVILPGRLNRLAIPKWKAIVHDVANLRGIPVEKIMGKKRTKHIAHARFECWSHMREQLGASYPDIAFWFNIDHTSVLHGVRRWDTQLKGMYA